MPLQVVLIAPSLVADAANVGLGLFIRVLVQDVALEASGRGALEPALFAHGRLLRLLLLAMDDNLVPIEFPIAHKCLLANLARELSMPLVVVALKIIGRFAHHATKLTGTVFDSMNLVHMSNHSISGSHKVALFTLDTV